MERTLVHDRGPFPDGSATALRDVSVHRPTTLQMRASVLDEIDALIGGELHRPLQLPEVARRVNVSARQLQRIYTESTGMTFRAHLRAARMTRAARLLRCTELSVAEVAEVVGYQQAAQFAKAFRAFHGTAPSAFRAAATATRGRGENGG